MSTDFREEASASNNFTTNLNSMVQELVPGFQMNSSGRNNNSETADGAANSVVIDLGTNGGEINANNGTDITEDDQTNNRDSRTSPPSIQSRIMESSKMFEATIPFLIILAVKLLFDHRLGCIVILCLHGTFIHYNSRLKKQVAFKEKRQLITLFPILCFLPLNIFIIYYLFVEEHLYKSLIFKIPNFEQVDFWTLLWILHISDFVVKFITVALKCILTIMPKRCLKFKKRGKYYLFIEQLSQLYRILLPIPVWTRYLIDEENGNWIFSNLLIGFYYISKGVFIYRKLVETKKIWKNLLTDVQYGEKPSKEQMLSAGDFCPICQEDYKDAIVLPCKHVFCEECVSIWFDRERTCPMCRAKIADDPAWKDGSTSAHVQLF